jgi:hypothetical protein
MLCSGIFNIVSDKPGIRYHAAAYKSSSDDGTNKI